MSRSAAEPLRNFGVFGFSKREPIGALHGLGLCWAALGEYSAAIQAFRRAQAIQPYALANQKLILECTALMS